MCNNTEISLFLHQNESAKQSVGRITLLDLVVALYTIYLVLPSDNIEAKIKKKFTNEKQTNTANEHRNMFSALKTNFLNLFGRT